MISQKLWRILTLGIFLSFITPLSGQTNLEDVVYLKNGNVIRGVILEQVPSVSIKIENHCNDIFIFKIDEIERITKEKLDPSGKVGKGYIGMSMSASMPTSKFKSSLFETSNGLQLNLINFGYLINSRFGISGNCLFAENPVLEKYDQSPYLFGAIMFGPIYSQPFSKKTRLDSKVQLGYSVVAYPWSQYGHHQSSAYAFGIGTQLRHSVGSKLSLTIGLDYFSTAPIPPEDFILHEISIRTISFGFGIARDLR